MDKHTDTTPSAAPPADVERVDLDQALHEAGHVLTKSLNFEARKGADTILVIQGNDHLGFYAQVHGLVNTPDGPVPMERYPLDIVSGPAASLLFDSRFTIPRAELLSRGVLYLPLLVELGICPDDAAELAAWNLSYNEQQRFFRGALLICMAFEPLVRIIGHNMVDQMAEGADPVARFDPAFIRSRVAGMEKLMPLANLGNAYRDMEVAQHAVDAITEASKSYALLLAKPYSGTVQ